PRRKEGCPCKFTTAPARDCYQRPHGVDPKTSLFWNQRNPTQTSWYKCKNQPCPNATPENSIPETFPFEDDEVLNPIPAPRVPTPEQEPTPPSPPLSTSELTTSLARLTVAGPSEKPDSPPTAANPVTPSPLDTPIARTEIPAFVPSEATFAVIQTPTNTRPSSAAAHRAPSPTASTTSTHTSESDTTNMSTSTTASQATLDEVLRAMVKSQKETQAQLDAIREAFQSNKEPGRIIAKPSNFKGETWDVARFLPMFKNWAIQEKVLQHPTEKDQLDERKTIQSALSFCEGKAGAWAAYYLIQANKVALGELPADQFPSEEDGLSSKKPSKSDSGQPMKRQMPSKSLPTLNRGTRLQLSTVRNSRRPQ
ncbi:hypothetical protein AAF712_014849, partial [Marasmius tenuissimus]